jgi:hypothetical protein
LPPVAMFFVLVCNEDKTSLLKENRPCFQRSQVAGSSHLDLPPYSRGQASHL